MCAVVTPRVSVVIPTHNRPELLSAAIRSVLQQSVHDFEIIVVDDGLDIRADDIVRSFADSRIRYLANERSLGGGGTRNRGIREARGEYVAFLDDDDTWFPNKLQLQVEAFAGAPTSVGFSITAVQNVFDSFERRTFVEEGIIDFSEIALRRFKGFLTSTLMVKRAVFDDVGDFDASLPSHQEAEFLIRVTRRYSGYGINVPLTRMNMSSGRTHIGGDLGRRIAGREMVLQKHSALFESHPSILAKHLFWLGLLYRDAGRCNEARSAFLRAWHIDHSLRYVLHYFVTQIRLLWL